MPWEEGEKINHVHDVFWDCLDFVALFERPEREVAL